MKIAILLFVLSLNAFGHNIERHWFRSESNGRLVTIFNPYYLIDDVRYNVSVKTNDFGFCEEFGLKYARHVGSLNSADVLGYTQNATVTVDSLGVEQVEFNEYWKRTESILCYDKDNLDPSKNYESIEVLPNGDTKINFPQFIYEGKKYVLGESDHLRYEYSRDNLCVLWGFEKMISYDVLFWKTSFPYGVEKDSAAWISISYHSMWASVGKLNPYYNTYISSITCR